ncbi:hypothetical protein [Modestobacter sp. NPDC049651]|uniref:hypothetical protein n=1 Tax=unclassified Modestobacter TaxID=2643866 RepID=UPI00340D7142
MTTELRTALTAAHADVVLGDPLDQVVRRGRRIRRARRARRTVPALVAAAAVVVGVIATRGGGELVTPSPVVLVDQQTQAFPLSFAEVPPGLAGPHLSLDPSFQRVGPGVAHAGWSDPADPADGIGISVRGDEPENTGDDVDEVSVHGVDATVHRDDTGPSTSYAVVWERADDQWVTVSGAGRFGSEEAVVRLARSVVDRPAVVPLQLTSAPRGWVLVAYKDDRIVTFADPAGPPATAARARTLSVSLPQPPSDPADLSREVTGGRVQPEQLTVHGRPAFLLPGAEGSWYLQAELGDGTVFVLQVPGDLTRDQVREVAEGVGRP